MDFSILGVDDEDIDMNIIESIKEKGRLFWF